MITKFKPVNKTIYFRLIISLQKRGFKFFDWDLEKDGLDNKFNHMEIFLKSKECCLFYKIKYNNIFKLKERNFDKFLRKIDLYLERNEK